MPSGNGKNLNSKAADRKSRGFLYSNISWGGFKKLTVLLAGHTYLFIGSGSHFLSWPRMERPQFCILYPFVIQQLSALGRQARGSGAVGFAF
jgi:hypothetical protein